MNQHQATSSFESENRGTVTVVKAVGLKKSYRTGNLTSEVLHGIDLEIMQGECLFLMGPSGSGKTTLLSILGCILSPDEGQLKILGEDVTTFSQKQQARFRREKIGFVFQRFHLFAGLTAQENVGVIFDLLGRSSIESKAESGRLLGLVGLSDKARHLVSQLSMGQRQRVALARALAANPEIILADEPTASLDAESGYNAMKLIKQLCRRLNKTAIIVTHDPRILPMADRVLHLRDGQIGSRSLVEANMIPIPTDIYSDISDSVQTVSSIDDQRQGVL